MPMKQNIEISDLLKIWNIETKVHVIRYLDLRFALSFSQPKHRSIGTCFRFMTLVLAITVNKIFIGIKKSQPYHTTA